MSEEPSEVVAGLDSGGLPESSEQAKEAESAVEKLC